MKGKPEVPVKYEHRQKAGVPFYLILAIITGDVFLAVILGGFPHIAWLVIFIVLPWGLLMMSSLTVRIDEYFLRVRFGPGVFFKRFPLSQIAACEPKYRTHCLGWGVRYYFGGWLYNVAGFKSVEITFKNGKKARIGTDEPEKLAESIREAISENS
jgi:hypothetical protein